MNTTNVKRCVCRIQELTSATDFEVSSELLRLLDNLYTESKKSSEDITSAVNLVNGADILVRIISILSGKEGLSQEGERCLEMTYGCICNLSDKREFCKCAANTCIVKKCIENLKAKEKFISEDSQIDEKLADVIGNLLGIIYNISRVENVESFFDDDRSILYRYKNVEKDLLVAFSVMILAHLSDGDPEKIQDEKDTTVYLIKLLRKAVKYEHRRAVGFSSVELIEGLGHLALNDNNKLTIVENNGLSLLMDLIRSQREEEMLPAAQCLWTLAFLPSIQKEFQQFRGEFEALSKSCYNKVVSETAEGILLTLKERHETTRDRPSRDGHIMISYAWDGGYGEKVARKIAYNLKSRGLKVWIDIDEMKGSLLDSMAQAVNDSYAFVLCASEKYRRSNNCKLEASFAHAHGKPIIPVVVGSNSIRSKSDWLMMLCSDRLSVDFTDERKFHQKCEELVQQIVPPSHDGAVPETVHETTSQPKVRESVAK